MTLENLYFFIGIITAIAIASSLVYLALQIRQNTIVLRINATNDRMKQDFDLTVPLIEDKELCKLWLQARTDFESLDEADKYRVIFFQRRVIMHWHSMYELRENNLLSDAGWNELSWLIRRFSKQQALDHTWKTFRPSFEKGFQDYMDLQFKTV